MSPKIHNHTAEFIQECFEVNLDAGLLIWKTRPRSHFNSDSGWKTFNSSEPGLVAGTIKNNGYLGIIINGVSFLAHRLIWLVHTGSWPNGPLDHINGIKTDNRISNLRMVTKSQNAMNSRLQKNNTSGVKGVDFFRPTGKWRVRIKANGIQKHLGHFASFEEASKVAQDARFLYHGEFANLG